MKKLIKSLLVIALMLVVGCTNLNNTPINRVEELLNSYQVLDEKIISDLNESLENTTYTDEQKEKYKEVMKEQYKSLTYQIKDDEINADKATVIVSITVKDYYKSIKESTIYFENHREEFLENGSYEKKFNDYKLDKLKDVKEKVTYTIEISLDKINGNWNIKTLDSETLDKISGIYEY